MPEPTDTQVKTIAGILNAHAQEFRAGHLDKVEQALEALIADRERVAELRGRIDELQFENISTTLDHYSDAFDECLAGAANRLKYLQQQLATLEAKHE